MKTINRPVISLCLTAFALGACFPLRAGDYFQDFTGFATGATNFGDGSQLFSTALGSVAAVQDPPYNELFLTANGATNVTSAFLLPDLDPGTPVHAFSVKWNSQVSGKFMIREGGNGFSLNFGQLRSLNLTNGNVEGGYGVGLTLGVQTYDENYPDPNENAGFFYVNVNGVNVALSGFQNS